MGHALGLGRGLLIFAWCLVFGALSGSAGAAGEQVRVSVVRSGSARLRVEAWPVRAAAWQDIWVRVTLEAPRDVQASPPAVGGLLGPFWVEQRETGVRLAGPDRRVLEQLLRLGAGRSGRLVIPALEATVESGGGGGTGTLRSDPLPVTVTTSLERLPPQWSDLAGPIGPLAPGAAVWPWAGLAASLALALAGLACWRRAGPRRAGGAARPLDPAEAARRELAALLAEDWRRRGVKWLYAELTAVVRRRLERSLGVPALERTTDELLARLREGRSLDAPLERLEALLVEADLVKFAGWRPSERQVERAVAAARELAEWPWSGGAAA